MRFVCTVLVKSHSDECSLVLCEWTRPQFARATVKRGPVEQERRALTHEVSSTGNHNCRMQASPCRQQASPRLSRETTEGKADAMSPSEKFSHGARSGVGKAGTGASHEATVMALHFPALESGSKPSSALDSHAETGPVGIASSPSQRHIDSQGASTNFPNRVSMCFLVVGRAH